MKVAFFHNHPMQKDASGRYYSVQYPRALWKNRYLKVFDKLTVVMRERPLRSGEVSAPSDCEGVIMRPISAYRRPFDLFLRLPAISRHIRAVLGQVDGCICRLPSPLGFLACREAIRQRKPWAVELVTCPWDSHWNHGSIAGKLTAPFFYLITRHYIKKAPFVLYVTESFLQSRYKTLGTAVAVSDVILDAPPPSVLAGRLTRIRENRPPLRLGLIGSLDVRFKGHETALRALASIRDALPPFRLCFLGTGDKTRFERLAFRLGLRDHVEFCGTLPPGDPILHWLDTIDIFLTPSRQDGVPRALVEAMSRGCPALGSRVGGIPELLPPDCLHPPGNAHTLSEQILRLAGSPDLMARRAMENSRRATDYTTDLLDRRRTAFWQDFVSAASGGNPS